MEFGRRKSFGFFEEDRRLNNNKAAAASRAGPAAGSRTPVHHHQYYSSRAAGSPARLSTSAVPSSSVMSSMPAGVDMTGAGSPWVSSPAAAGGGIVYHCLAALHRLDGDVHALAVSRGVLFTASDSGRVRAWAAPGCFDRGYLDVGRGRVPALAACGGTLVTSHSRDHHVRVWTVAHAADAAVVRAKKAATLPATRSPLHFFHHLPGAAGIGKRHRDTVSCLVLHAVAGLLYTASHDQTVKAWKLADGTCVDSFLAHDGPVNAMLVNELDGCVFTASADGTVKMWRRVYGGTAHALVVVLRASDLYSPVNALTLCHSAAPSISNSSSRRMCCFLYAGSSDGYVNVWEKEATAGRPVHAGYLRGHRLAVFCLASGCGGRVVVSGSEDATMRVWRRESSISNKQAGGGGVVVAHTCLAVIEGHRGPVRCLAVGGAEAAAAGDVDGSMVVYSAGLDKTVKVWRIRVVPAKEEEDPAAAEVKVVADGVLRDDDADVFEDDNDDDLPMEGPTPILSPVWVEKRRHTSRG